MLIELSLAICLVYLLIAYQRTSKVTDTDKLKIITTDQKMFRPTHAQHGFTLVEILVTVSIASIISTAAAPSLSSMIRSNQLTSQVNSFVSAMNMARSESVKRGENVRVVAINSATTSDEWGPGWNVVDDTGTNIKFFASLGSSATLDSTANVATFVYQSNGRVDVIDILNLCDSNLSGETGRQINVTATGRVATSEITCL